MDGPVSKQEIASLSARAEFAGQPEVASVLMALCGTMVASKHGDLERLAEKVAEFSRAMLANPRYDVRRN